MSKQDRRRPAGRGRRDSLDSVNDDPMAAGHRHERLQHILHEELSALLRDEVADPVLRDVRVASVELSVDYSNARVRFGVLLPAGTPPGPAPVAAGRQAERSLERAAGFLRARLCTTLDLKRIPNLRFVCDGALHREEGPCG